MVLEHFKKQSHGNQLEELEIVIEIKNLLDKTGDYFKTLDLFLNDEEGYYEKQDILELLANLNFKDEKKIKKFIGMLFNHKE